MIINPGELYERITLQEPGTAERDELGGVAETTYTSVGSFYAKVTAHNLSRSAFVGDFVTADTRFFILRDIRRSYPDINAQWRIIYKGFTWLINRVEVINDIPVTYLQITATAINSNGGAV